MPLELTSIKVKRVDGLDESRLRIDLVLSNGVEVGSMCVVDKTTPDYSKIKDGLLIRDCVKDLVNSVLEQSNKQQVK